MGGQVSGEQKAQLEAYLKEIGRYAQINKGAYQSLIDNLDSLDTGFFDNLIGLLPEETPDLEEIRKDHGGYKGLFTKGKKNIHEGGALDRLFEKYKSVIKGEKKTPQQVESAFREMDKTYVSLVNGILMTYNPRILSVYQQIAENVKEYAERGKKIKRLLTILKSEYKAEELIKRIMQEQAG